MNEISVRAVAFAVTAMAFVGSSVAVSHALTAAPLCTAQAARYALAAVILVVLARLLRIPVVRPRGAEWLWLAGTSVSGLVLFNIAVVRGVAHAQPAMIAVAVACVPVLLGVLGPLLQRQSPHRRIVLAAGVVTAGAVLVEGAGHADVAGAAWAVLALVCEAGFTLLAVPVLGRHGAWGVSVHTVWMGAVMFGALGLAGEGPSAVTRLTIADLLAVAYLALLVTVAAFLLWYTAVSALGPARAGLITGAAPVSASLAGLALGTRAPNVLMWLGIAVVAVGLAFGLRSRQDGAGSRSGDSDGRRGAAGDGEAVIERGGGGVAAGGREHAAEYRDAEGAAELAHGAESTGRGAGVSRRHSAGDRAGDRRDREREPGAEDAHRHGQRGIPAVQAGHGGHPAHPGGHQQ